MKEWINLLLIVPPALRALNDYIQIEIEKKSIEYFKSNVTTFLLMVLCCVFPFVTLRVTLLEVGIMALSTYWLIFDYLLNLFRGKPVLSYYGDFSDKKNLSFIEKYFYQRTDWRVLLALKLIIFGFSIYIYEFRY